MFKGPVVIRALYFAANGCILQQIVYKIYGLILVY